MAQSIYKRRFQMTDLKDNHNKYWQVEVFDDGWFETTFGRVGSVNEPSRKQGGIKEAEKIIREKERKGYKEVVLHVPAVVASDDAQAKPMNAQIKQLVDLVFEEAGLQSKSYLTVGVDELGQSQIDEARLVMMDIQARVARGKQTKDLVPYVETFYNLIPTKLPSRIEMMSITEQFVNDMSTHEDRLNQLEAAIAGYKTRVVKGMTGVEALGGIKVDVADQSPEAQAIKKLIMDTRGYNHYDMVSLFKVEIPSERKAYEENEFGILNKSHLIHGTNNFNLQYILKGGLICPKVHAHGRYYGDGIYFADRSQKSLNYVGGRTHLRTLLVCEVALGNMWVAPDRGCHERSSAPEGYHSTRSPRTPSGLNEFIVYNNNQATIKYIALMN